jgi:tagatose-6-phosphate ketose/aldose isomerase
MNVADFVSMQNTCVTQSEINSQPMIWREFAVKLSEHAREVRAWISRFAPEEIWLCGAGTSAYIGETICTYLDSRSTIRHRAVATTSLVGSPQDYVLGDRRILVVSFGRSGDSPETVGTLDILDKCLPNAARLNITCNESGALAQRSANQADLQMTIVLPDECHDRGFAMTSSFTTMLLTALACLDSIPLSKVTEYLRALAQSAERVLASAEAFAATHLAPPPERAVFIGTGTLTGIARESALKVLELTRGAVSTHWESSLGFRHGPKAILNQRTVAFAYLSCIPHSRRYDVDLIEEVRRQLGVNSLVTVGPAGLGANIELDPVDNDAWSAVLYVLLPQIVAVKWGLALGIKVDSPFVSEELNRVVSGVTLYDYQSEK